MFKQTISIVCIFFLSFNAWGFININQAYPDPGLKPNKVVAIQLLAMQQNGASDYGNKIGEPIIGGFTRSIGVELGKHY